MSKKPTRSWAYATISITIPEKVEDERVIKTLSEWFGRKFPYTKRNSHAISMKIDPPTVDGEYGTLQLAIHKRYNPHYVAEKVEKKLNKLLAASTSS